MYKNHQLGSVDTEIKGAYDFEQKYLQHDSKTGPSPLIQDKFDLAAIEPRSMLSIDSDTETESLTNIKADHNIDLDFNLFEQYDLENQMNEQEDF